jgi:mannosyltransferase OCH1-like enzyme
MRASWRTLHPDWTFMDWDLPKARALIAEHYPDYLAMFDNYKRDIYRIDSCRYFILHHYGGVYADTDITCLQRIDKLCQFKNVICLNAYTKKFINNNHFFMAIPHSEFMTECIRRLPSSALLQTAGDSWTSTMLVAGPGFLTGVAMTYKKRKDLFTIPHEEEQAFFIHHEKHSWKVGRSILGDVGRVSLVAGGVAAGIFFTKRFIDQHGGIFKKH